MAFQTIKMDNRPYNKFVISLKYIYYFITAQGKHATHSPWVYQFITTILKYSNNSSFSPAEKERKKLKQTHTSISFIDFGKSGLTYDKKIKTIAQNSLKSKKYAQLLRRVVQVYQAKSILELGTSLGITTAYLAYDKSINITTLEGSNEVLKLAKKTWEKLGITQIESILGDFNQTLDTLGNKIFDVIYIDGNHQYEPTLSYFHKLQSHSHPKTLFIFDDIHYSPAMEMAWKEIQKMPQVTLTIDLFFLGFVWIDTRFSKEKFNLRF